MGDSTKVGQRIRQLREQQDMSLEELAQKAKINIELALGLEAGQVGTGLAPLLQISRALGVRLGTFLDDHTTVDTPVVHRHQQFVEDKTFSGSLRSLGDKELSFHPLASDKADRHMEPFIIDIIPSSEEHLTSTHEGEEFIYILSGQIEIIYGKDKYILNKGDSIYYNSIIPHHVHGTDTPAQILAVVYQPI